MTPASFITLPSDPLIMPAIPKPDHGAAPAPRATYRLQLHAGFTFEDAAKVSGYLRDLGVSDLYASPVLLARKGSTHGYDVCNFSRFNTDLGGATGFKRLTTSLRKDGLNLLLDFVPNHMGIGDLRNGWWVDLLRFGPHAVADDVFDVRWDGAGTARPATLQLPVLGQHCTEALAKGELRLTADRDGLWLAYHEKRFPLSPRSVAQILARVLERQHKTQSRKSVLQRLQEIVDTLRNAARPARRRQTRQVHQLEWTQGWNAFWTLQKAFREVRNALNAVILESQSDAAGCVPLREIVAQQYYRLRFWKDGLKELNYRRFFDIADLAGVRMEDADVFESAHRMILKTIHRHGLRGLRIDHPDGLRDPTEYFVRLQRAWQEFCSSERSGSPGRPLYILAEKILGYREPLPTDWPIAGTTGYDFLSQVNGLFVAAENWSQMERAYGNFTGTRHHYPDEVFENRLRVLTGSLSAELDALTDQWMKLVRIWPRSGSTSREPTRTMLARMLACLPVYRTYLSEHSTRLTNAAHKSLAEGLAALRRRSPDLPPGLLRALGETLTLRGYADQPPKHRRVWMNFVLRFQQLSGPAMAKGLEDTTFYTYVPLLSVNDVGAHPEHPSLSVAEFHRANRERLRCWPDTMLTTATHDTKRGEDVRARINVLSEMPGLWEAAVKRWAAWNARHKTPVNDQPAPSSNDEYLLYQTLVGCWPFALLDRAPTDEFRERIQQYVLKAIREAKTHTSWTDPCLPYESAAQAFVERILSPASAKRFLRDLQRFIKRLTRTGCLYSLAQTALKLTVPGVPDTYQGTEFWDLNLVDPDNRRPVDFNRRIKSLARLRKSFSAASKEGQKLAARLLDDYPSGEVKQFLVWRLLQHRRANPELYARGDYLPVRLRGAFAGNGMAFLRRQGDQALMVIVPRLGLSLGTERRWPLGERAWKDTSVVLPRRFSTGTFRNVLTGQRLIAGDPGRESTLRVSRLLADFPVGVWEVIPRSYELAGSVGTAPSADWSASIRTGLLRLSSIPSARHV